MLRTAVFVWFCLLMGNDVLALSTTPILREETTVVVDGVEEVWGLQWLGSPKPVCGPDGDDWMTCPCEGFVFGESGDLRLVRKRHDKPEEVLHLTPLFESEEDRPAGGAVLRRWDKHEDDFDQSKEPGFAASVKARPLSTMMRFADYDHDGRATEFALQIGNQPCGKLMCVVVGISRKNPRLHVFSSLKNPGKPLILRDSQWNALAKANEGMATVIDWRCGDHGSGNQEEVALSAQDGQISASRIWYKCRLSKKGKPVRKKEF